MEAYRDGTLHGQGSPIDRSIGIPSNLIEIMMKDFRTYFKRIFSPVTDLQQVNKTAKFYENVCEALGIKPSAMIHVGDDVLHDFEIPRTAGISSFLLDRTGEKTGEYVIRNLRELEDRMISIDQKREGKQDG